MQKLSSWSAGEPVMAALELNTLLSSDYCKHPETLDKSSNIFDLKI